MSEEKSDDAVDNESATDPRKDEPKTKQSGPTFTEAPNPLSGVRKATGDAWKSTEGKNVSLRVYIGSIIGVILLMMLARCGG